jgi:hypothetical protein
MTDVTGLKDYRWSSYWYLRHPELRPEYMELSGALLSAGGLSDDAQGHRSYEQYLEWLSGDEGARKEMAFDAMCRGWALGSKDFKRGLLESEGLLKHGSFERMRMEGIELKEANELIWENCLERCLLAAGKIDHDITSDKKSARWKIWIAAEFKRNTSAPSTWIAQKLNMGAPQLVGVYVNRLNRELAETPDFDHQALICQYTE